MFELPVLTPGTQAHTCAVRCGARCCNHLSVPIDAPTTNADFDDLRWYLMHEDTNVYKLDGQWQVLVYRRCRHLLPNNLCGNYENRPKVCDDYDASTCEFTGEPAYQHYFQNDAELDTFIAARKAKRSAAAKKRRRVPRK